ncbi:MAG TPA: TrkH family potassium uptake protein, partial [Burkholderiaceae bacterium]|nr:TrkH family potassium uptake protein [Burkholderiaceae bacterium]
MTNLLPVVHVFAALTIVFGASMAIPLAVSAVLGDDRVAVFATSAAITAGAGVLLWLVSRAHRRELQARDAFLLVSLAWAGLPAFATLPL